MCILNITYSTWFYSRYYCNLGVDWFRPFSTEKGQQKETIGISLNSFLYLSVWGEILRVFMRSWRMSRREGSSSWWQWPFVPYRLIHQPLNWPFVVFLIKCHVLLSIHSQSGSQCMYTLLCFQLVANAIVFVCVNVAGMFLHNITDRAQRKTFLDTRNCIAARLEIQDENDKLVSRGSLLGVVSVVSFLRVCMSWCAPPFSLYYFFSMRERCDKVLVVSCLHID